MKLPKDFEQYIILSLPYNLRVTAWYGKNDLFFKLHPYLDAATYPSDGEHLSIGNFFEENIDQYSDKLIHKPMLRPLEDIIKTITQDGEEFVPMKEIAIYDEHGFNYLFEQIKLGLVETIVFFMLIKWHFDVYGLIEKGLAVNVNDLIINPYE